MKIYTLTGDDGTTSLSGGRRVPKTHIRIEAYGTVDELISWIGLLRSCRENETRKEILIYIQGQLMAAASALAYDSQNELSRQILPDAGCVDRIEAEIDLMEAQLPDLTSFILPGGNVVASYCHVSRVVCRRAERSVLRLKEKEEVPEIVLKFLNRLSDYLFVLSRIMILESENEEVKWPV